MEEIREELDKINLEMCRLKDISELLGDYFFNNLVGREHSKGDTLVTILIEKLNVLDNSIMDLSSLAWKNKGNN